MRLGLRKLTGSEEAAEEEVAPSTDSEVTHKHGLERHVVELGGPAIFAWRLSRVLACAGLFALGIFTTTLDGQAHDDGTDSEPQKYVQFALAGVYVRNATAS